MDSLRYPPKPVALSAIVVGLVAVLTVALAGRGQQPSSTVRPLPLETTRTVKFTTNEGTWMSVDVSPDGRTMIFDLLGDLYTLPIEGGHAQRITDGLAFDAQPRYSPDGRSIVFVSDRSGAQNLWLADADGRRPRALTTGDQVMHLTGDYVSPEWIDAQTVAVSRSDPTGQDLVLYDIRGGRGLKMTNVTTPSGTRYMGVAAGGDPRYWYVSGASGAGAMGIWQVHRYDRDTATSVALTNSGGGGLRPVVSPNGRYLVYATRRDAATMLTLRDLESGIERWLLDDVQHDAQERGIERDLMPGSSFTPDGGALITSYGGRIWRVTIPDGSATEIPFTAAIEQQLGPLTRFDYRLEDGPVTARQIRDPRVSPDGRQIAFNALRHIWTVDRSGGTPRRVTPVDVGAYAPAWSPDGQFLAYTTWNDAEGGHVYRVRSDGSGQPEQLTRQAAFYYKLAYAPDGQRLVCVRGPLEWRRQHAVEPRVASRPVGMDLVWVPAAGGDVTPITPLEVPVYQWAAQFPLPHFVRDNDRVYINDATDGLVSMRFDGTDRRLILKAKYTVPPTVQPGPEEPAYEMLMAPDGRQVLIQVHRSLYVATLPHRGGPPPTLSFDNLAGAPIPVVRASRFGGDFPTWSADGRTVHYAIGRSFFSHDLAAAETAPPAKASDPRPYETRIDITITIPRDVPQGTIVLRGARILTLETTRRSGPASSGNATPSAARARAPFDVIEKGDIVVINNRITAVGPSGRVPVPAGARVIDAAGKTIMPGLIDIHAHMGPSSAVHRSEPWEYLANLAYGVTTTRDAETTHAGFDVATYGDLVDAGVLIGPRILATGPGLVSMHNIRSLEETREVLGRYSEHHQTRTLKEYVVGNRRVRQWLVMAAREQQLTPTSDPGATLVRILTFMLDGYAGVEHPIPVVPLYQDVVRFAAESGTAYTPTLLVNVGRAEDYFYQREDVHDDTKLRRFIPHHEIDARTLRRTSFFREDQFVFGEIAAQAGKIVAAGGRVALGAHGQLQGLGVHWELWAMASGMPNADALRVGTIMGADAIGLAQDLGSIAPGKLADLLVLDKNPLDDIRNSASIRYVMKNGRLYEGDTLKEIWPRQRELGPHAWRESVPPKGRAK